MRATLGPVRGSRGAAVGIGAPCCREHSQPSGNAGCAMAGELRAGWGLQEPRINGRGLGRGGDRQSIARVPWGKAVSADCGVLRVMEREEMPRERAGNGSGEQRCSLLGSGERRRGSWDAAPLTDPRCWAPQAAASAPCVALTGSQRCRCCSSGTQAQPPGTQALGSRMARWSSTQEPCPAVGPTKGPANPCQAGSAFQKGRCLLIPRATPAAECCMRMLLSHSTLLHKDSQQHHEAAQGYTQQSSSCLEFLSAVRSTAPAAQEMLTASSVLCVTQQGAPEAQQSHASSRATLVALALKEISHIQGNASIAIGAEIEENKAR